jgi:hypothetical protein
VKARLAACVVCALAPAAAADPLPLVRDDGASWVDVGGAAAAGADQDLTDTSQAIDVAAQAMLTDAVGVYGAFGGARATESYFEDLPPPGRQVDVAAYTPLDLELGAVLRLHDDAGRALAFRAGASLPTMVRSAVIAEPADLSFEAADPLDVVRSVNRTALRAAIEPSLHDGGFIVAGQLGVDVVPTAAEPVRIGIAAAIGGETVGGTSVVFGLGGYRVLGASPFSPSTSVVAGLDVAHRFDRTWGYLGVRGGTSPRDMLVAALVAGVRWSL